MGNMSDMELVDTMRHCADVDDTMFCERCSFRNFDGCSSLLLLKAADRIAAGWPMRKEASAMDDKCKWYAEFEGVCCNWICPFCADSCPVDGRIGVCQFDEGMMRSGAKMEGGEQHD